MAALGHIKGPCLSALPKKPVCLMATHGPAPAQGAEGLSGGKWKEKREQRGENTGAGTQSCGSLPRECGLPMNPLVRVVLALADLYLECSTQPLFLLLQCTSRQAFQVTFAKCFVYNFTSTSLESAFATAEGCWGFSLPHLVV